MSSRVVHVLKCEREPFAAVRAGEKTAEWRKDDRGYEVGHLLHLFEYDVHERRITGRQVLVEVTHLLRGEEDHPFGLPEGYVVLSIRKIA